MRNQRNHTRRHVARRLALASLLSAVTLLLSPAISASPQTVGASWSYTGSLNNARQYHTATLLLGGKVLVAGGYGNDDVLSSAELYDPATGTWSSTGNLNTARAGHTATLLPGGKVLVAGGYSNDDWLSSAELYDSATGRWSNTGNLNLARLFHTATLLSNGKVLVAGGNDSAFDNTLKSTELYDPVTETWSNTGNLNEARETTTATLLQNGKVLVAGGYSCFVADGCYALNSAELYNPSTGIWSSTGNLNTARGIPTATMLPSGKVLVVEEYSNTAELYDPATGTWNFVASLNNTARGATTATLLLSGKVLAVGGYGNRTPELYDPATGTWSFTASLNTIRGYHTATLLPSGKVLVAAGTDNFSGHSSDSAELYDPGVSNQIDDAQYFVRQHYLDFLNRQPDAGGLAYWTDRITQCGSDSLCIHERRIGVSAAFFMELEFQDTGYFVYRFYKASFGRQPNYTEFTADRSKVIGGSNLEAKKQAFADEWVQRAVFTQAYPITMSNTEVVNKLFDWAGLTASIYDALRQQEIAAMNAGRSRALVLRDVIEIPDFRNIPDPNNPRYAEIKQISQYNPAFVLMQYFGYLKRNVDQRGYDFWLDIVNNRQPNNYHGMVCSFITSTEYQLRFGSVVTRSNADCGQ